MSSHHGRYFIQRLSYNCFLIQQSISLGTAVEVSTGTGFRSLWSRYVCWDCPVTCQKANSKFTADQFCSGRYIWRNSGNQACHSRFWEATICETSFARNNTTAPFLTSQQYNRPYRRRCYLSGFLRNVRHSFFMCVMSECHHSYIFMEVWVPVELLSNW